MNVKVDFIKKSKILFASLVLLSLVLIVIGIFYFAHLQQRRARILQLIETYYGQSDYATAEALAVNMLLDNPEDRDAAAWHAKIRAARLKKEQEKAGSTPAVAGPGKYDSLLQNLFAELKKIKTKLADLERNNNGRRIAYLQRDNTRTARTDKAEERPEQDITELMHNGLKAFESKDYGKAKYYFLKARKLRETDPDANALLAASIYRENPQDEDNLKKAVIYCKTALTSDRQNKLAYVTLGDIYQTRNNRELAVNNYLEALNIDPDDASLYYRVAVLHYEMGEMEKAGVYFNKALALKKELPSAYLYLGRIQKKKGALEQALNYFKQAIVYDKSFYSAYVELGDCYVERKEYAPALDMYNHALELKQSLSVGVKKADCLLALGMSSKAESGYRYAVAKNPARTVRERENAATLFYDRALIALGKKNYKNVSLLAQIGISTGARQSDFYLLLGKVSRKTEEYEQAEEYCAKSLKADEYNTGAYLELALTYTAQGEKAQALSVLKLLSKKIPASADTASFKETQRIVNER